MERSEYYLGKKIKRPRWKKKQKLPIQAYTAGAPYGVAIAYFKKPTTKKDQEGYIKPALDKMEDDPSLQQDWEIDDVVARRDPHASDNQDSDWEWRQLARIYPSADDNTPENRRKWIESGILKELNHLGPLPKNLGGFRYKTTFKYMGDTSFDPPKPLDYYFLDDDVIALTKQIYPDVSLTEMSDSDEFLAGLFADTRRGAALLRQKVEAEA